jgi:hypothetical protein
MAPVERQPGEWESPITSQLITSATKRLGAVSFAPNGALLWLEGRPSEKGRQVLVRRPANGGAAEDVTPPPASGLNVRTRVQEYGGGEYVLGPGAVYFSNFADQRLYVQQLPESGGPPSEPRPLTAADSKQRFADGDVDATRNRLVCVVEDHSVEGEAKTTVGAVGESQMRPVSFKRWCYAWQHIQAEHSAASAREQQEPVLPGSCPPAKLCTACADLAGGTVMT